MKKLFFLYQDSMFYIAQTAGEYGKLAGFVNNILLAATFLATVFNIHLSLKQLALLWFVLMMSCYGIGIVLVRTGVTAYNARLANKQNPELLEILEILKEMKHAKKD